MKTKFLLVLALAVTAFSQAPVTVGRWEIAASNGTYPNAVNANFYNVEVLNSSTTASTAQPDWIFGRANFSTGVICIYPTMAKRNAGDTTQATACATGVNPSLANQKITLAKRHGTTSATVNYIKKFTISGAYDWDIIASNVSASMVDSAIVRSRSSCGLNVNCDSTGTDSLVRNNNPNIRGAVKMPGFLAVKGVTNHNIEPEGGATVQIFKDSVSAISDNSNLQLLGYSTGAVLHFINGGGTVSAPRVSAQGSASSIGWRFFGNVAGNVRANASSAAIIVAKTGTDTGAVPAADMSLQVASGGGTRPTVIYLASTENVGIGSYYSASQLPTAHLAVRGSQTEQINLFGTATTGDNYALDVNQVGAGAASNTGIYINVGNATANTGIEIHAPTSGASNYAIKSTSTAQSFFGGSMDATAYKVGGAAGVSCSVTAVTGLTVVNGIVTACSGTP